MNEDMKIGAKIALEGGRKIPQYVTCSFASAAICDTI